MEFKLTDDDVYYLYDYFSLQDKTDENSKKVYKVFKKDDNFYYDGIFKDFCDAFKSFFTEDSNLAMVRVCIVPSHNRGGYGVYLKELAKDLCEKFGMINNWDIIYRTKDKTKSTAGGVRTVSAHLETLGLRREINIEGNAIVILDDITTSGVSLEAAKQVVLETGIKSKYVYKIAISKTCHANW